MMQNGEFIFAFLRNEAIKLFVISERLYRFNRRPSYRTITTDPEIWREAGVLSGTLAGTQGYGREQRRRVLDDALLFATARKYGCVVLSSPVECCRSNSDAEQTLARRRRDTGHSLAFSTVPRSRKVVRHY